MVPPLGPEGLLAFLAGRRSKGCSPRAGPTPNPADNILHFHHGSILKEFAQFASGKSTFAGREGY